MEVQHIIDADNAIVSLAYNRLRKEIYSASEGDKSIKVWSTSRTGPRLWGSNTHLCSQCCMSVHVHRGRTCTSHTTPISALADAHCRRSQVWDLLTGQLVRIQHVHKGAVTSLVFASSVSLLFSGSIDGSIGVWTDKGVLLQVRERARRSTLACEKRKIATLRSRQALAECRDRQHSLAFSACCQEGEHACLLDHIPQLVPTGWAVFCMAWSPRNRMLAAGGNSVLHVFTLDLADAR